MPTFASDQMLGATAISATLGYIVPNSASPDGSTGYLSRTPGSASGNSQFWISVWIKLGKVGVQQEICSAYGGGTGLYIRLLSTHELQIQNYAGTVYKKSTPLYRDPTGWAHLFLSFDGSTDIDGWWNGAAIAWGTNGTLPSSYDWHNNVLHRIFSPAHDVSSLWTGYAAHFASGSGAVGDVNDCGEADADANWVPKNLTGLTWGTNGFWLKFENGADLGEDSSGNANTWTVNGTIAQTTDTSSDDAENDIGNFATLCPLSTTNATTGGLSKGNLTQTASTSSNVRATIAIDDSTDFYAEATLKNYASTKDAVGINSSLGWEERDYAGADLRLYAADGSKYEASGWTGGFGATYTTNDVIGIKVSGRVVTFYKNNTLVGSLTAVSGTKKLFFHSQAAANASQWEWNFGQKPFVYTPPTGCVPLCTANLPAPATAASVTPLTGSVTCNGTTDNAFVWLGYTPDTAGSSTLGGSALTWGTHAIPTAGGFKIISASFNGSVAYSIAVERPFGGEGVSQARAQ